jgi:hypothetical protein
METEESAEYNNNLYIKKAIPDFIAFALHGLVEPSQNQITTYSLLPKKQDPSIWNDKEEGTNQEDLNYSAMALMFRFCKEQQYPVRIFKDHYRLLIGFESIDEYNKLNRYTMRMAEFKAMQIDNAKS